MADGHLLCPPGRAGPVRTTRHSWKGRAHGTQGRLEQCWEKLCWHFIPSLPAPAVCPLLPVPSSLQGDRGFDGQQGAKGDQGEKGDRVSRLQRDGMPCTTLLVPGYSLGWKHIRAWCSQKSHSVLL